MSAGDAGAWKATIPTWDGASETFQAYQEAARLYEQTVEYKKRYLCGPQLQRALEGSAKRFVVGKPPAWLSYQGGVECLLDHLRQCLGKPQMPELTELLGKYFRGSKRRSGETMNEYISRKCEVYVRAQQAMGRVRPYHESGSTGNSRWTGNPGSWPGVQGLRLSTSSWASGNTEVTENEGEAPPTQPAAPTASEAETTETQDAETTWSGQWQWNRWDWQGYNWSGSWYGAYQGYQGTWQGGQDTAPPTLPDLVPEFIQAWLLLNDASLEASERNMILTALQGQLTLQKVAQELRNQFPEAELKRREPHRKQQGYWGEGCDSEDPDAEYHPEVDFDSTELSAEGYAMWTEAESEVQSAMAAMQQAKRTLRGAREKQKQVRLNRQYYQSSGGKGSSSRSDDKIICMRCGEQGHRAAVCPASKPKGEKAEKQMAPFVCYVEESTTETAWHATAPEENEIKITTTEAVEQGKAVIDCGATRSLGSVYALERVLHQTPLRGSTVDVHNRPTFGFANSEEDTCLSTLHLQLSAGGRLGTLQVHALDRGQAPILLSVSTLKKLKAVIDFEDGTMVLRGIDANQVLQLEESSTGHLLLSLTDDLLSRAMPTSSAVPRLWDYVKSPARGHPPPE